ncbi:DNA methyltransferase [Helicobacter pylori]|uniref:DNA methyltransferase n=1 Tax=Helicobacter pylori TaxID=210 RepID=UPI00311F7263
MLHNLWGNNAFISNLALVCDRGSKVSPISNVFVTSMLCDLHLNGSGSYAFLLYRLK